MYQRTVTFFGATALLFSGAVGMATPTYYQTNDFSSSNSGTASAQDDFAQDVQFGAYGTRTPTVTPNFNAGSVALEGDDYQDSSLALINTAGSDATPFDSTGDGLYGYTDAVVNFTLVGPTNDVQFGMASRIDGSDGNVFGHGATAPLPNNSYNDYPAYYCNFAGGTLTLMEQSAYSGGALPGTQLAQETGISLAGGSDAYQLEMVTGSGGTPTITVTLSENGTAVGSISAVGGAINYYYGGNSPDSQGEVAFYGGSNTYLTTADYGIEATSFSVNAPVGAPEPTAIGLVTLVGSGLMLKRRRRAM